MAFDNYQLQQELKRIWEARLTGTMTCELKGYDKTLFIRDGIVCFATSTDPDDKLPSILIRQGRFTEDQFEQAEPNFNDAISVGRNLVEMGLITQAELVEGAKGQIYSIFSGCMQAEQGQLNFQTGDLPQGIVSLPLKFPRDIFRAILEMNDKSWISDQFENGLVFIPVPKEPIDFKKLDVNDFAESVYKLIDGTANFSHLAFDAEIDEFTLLKFLYALRFLGHIEIIEDHDEPEPDVGDVRDDLSNVFQQRDALEMMNSGPIGKMSMEETVDLPKSMLAQKHGSMDATMEISRSSLGGDLLDPDNPLGDRLNHFEDEYMADPLSSVITRDEEPDEEGLDDLDAHDAFAEELARMQAPLDPPLLDIDDPYPEDKLEEEDEEEERGEEEDPNRKRRLFLLCGIGFLLIGGLLAARPYLLNYLLAPEPVPQEQLADLKRPELDNKDVVPADLVPNPAEAVPIDPSTPVTTEPEADPGPATEPEASAAPEPETTNEVVPAEAAPQEQVEAVAETSKPPVTSEEPPQVDTEAPVATPTDPNAEWHPDSVPPAARRLGGSPVGDDWDRLTGRPRGRIQAAVEIPDESSEGFDYEGETLPDPPKSPVNPTDTAELKPEPKGKPILPIPAPEITAPKTAEPTAATPVTPTEVAKAGTPTEPDPKALTQTQAPVKTGTPAEPEPKAPAQAQAAGETTTPSTTQLKPIKIAEKPIATPPTPLAQPETDLGQVRKQAAEAMAAEDYAKASELWRKVMAGSKQITLGSLACDPSSLRKAQQEDPTGEKLFILAKPFKGKACYWLCWGTFNSKGEALLARKNIPPGVGEPSEVEVRPISSL